MKKRKIVAAALPLLLIAALIRLMNPQIFYRLAVSAGCVEMLFESYALDELPPDILYATAQIVNIYAGGDFGITVVEVGGLQSFRLLTIIDWVISGDAVYRGTT